METRDRGVITWNVEEIEWMVMGLDFVFDFGPFQNGTFFDSFVHTYAALLRCTVISITGLVF